MSSLKTGRPNGRTGLRAPRFVERSLTIAAFGLAVGAVLVALGIVLDEVLGTIIASLGATLISLAVLSVAYDAYLKDILLGEIYEAIGIHQSLQAIDLRQVAPKDHIDMADVLEGATKITSVPVDPETWSRTDWHHLLKLATDRPMEIVVLLPDQDSPHIDVLAARLGMAREQLADRIAELPDKLGKSWDEKGTTILASKLNIYLYGTVPATGLMVTDSTVVIETPPALSHTPTDRRTLALIFGRRGWQPLVTDFVDDQLFADGRMAESRIPGFSSSVMRPLQASISPDPDAHIPERSDAS